MRKKKLPVIISAALAVTLMGCSGGSAVSSETTAVSETKNTEESIKESEIEVSTFESETEGSTKENETEVKTSESETTEGTTEGETKVTTPEGETEESTQETETEEGTQETETEEGTQESETAEEAAKEPSVEKLLEKVAEKNGCEVKELNYNLDDRGYVNFLGAAFTDSVISDENDARKVIDELLYLAGLKGCSFEFYRKDVSPVSKLTYYTFSQVAMPDEDENLPIAYSYSLIKIIADENGQVKGFSADIADPDSLIPISKENYVSQSEAEKLVEEGISKDCSIISESTVLGYWDDDNKVSNVTNAKKLPVWIIYTNEACDRRPYTMYVVPAMKDEEDSVEILDRFACSELKTESDTYTSDLFFAGMEDAGKFTYTIDMTWAYDAETGYEAEKEIEVTVPVMYDPESKLYYLADINEKIAVANQYDFNQNLEINALVSENPKDMTSWHFASMEGPDGEEYFCDINYVLASYDTMLTTYNIYKERYGYNSVDYSGIPILLLTYTCGDEYPTDEAEFEENAFNIGQLHHWAVFANSPAYTGCVDVATMAHEFAHGINSQLTNSHYFNEMGAVMEGYADSIGENLAYLNGYKSEDYADTVGSKYCSPERSFSDPYEYNNPKYIGGANYVSPAVEVCKDEFDDGGVHDNSSVVNYLCYNLYSNEDEKAAVLDRGTVVDMFIETLYCATYTTGYDELGSYIIFAAGNVDISDEQYGYTKATVRNLGFKGEREKLTEYIAEEGSVLYSVKVTADENIAESLVFGAFLLDEYNGDTVMGMTDENGYVGFRSLEEDENYRILLTLYFSNSGLEIGDFVTDVSPDQEVYIDIKNTYAKAGQTIDFDGEISAVYCYSDDSMEVSEIECDGNSITLEEKCIYTVTYVDGEGVVHYSMFCC